MTSNQSVVDVVEFPCTRRALLISHIGLASALALFILWWLLAGRPREVLTGCVMGSVLVAGFILAGQINCRRYRRKRWAIFEQGSVFDAVVLDRPKVFTGFSGYQYVKVGYLRDDSTAVPLDAQPIPHELEARTAVGCNLQIIAAPDISSGWIPIIEVK